MFRLSEDSKTDLHNQGKALSAKLTRMVHEGHYRKVMVLNGDGQHLFEFPLLLGVVVTLIFPLIVGFLLLFFLMSGWHAEMKREV